MNRWITEVSLISIVINNSDGQLFLARHIISKLFFRALFCRFLRRITVFVSRHTGWVSLINNNELYGVRIYKLVLIEKMTRHFTNFMCMEIVHTVETNDEIICELSFVLTILKFNTCNYCYGIRLT